MAAFCASIGRVLTHRSGTVNRFSTSELGRPSAALGNTRPLHSHVCHGPEALREAMLVLFHKPYGVLSQFTAEGSRWRTLADFIALPDVYAAGRLDADSEGLLLLTDNGRLQAAIATPEAGIEKTYWAQVEGIVDEDALQRLRQGVALREGSARARRARALPTPDVGPRDPPIRVRRQIPDSWLELTIAEGRNRQVRRMTAALGLPTLRLLRVAVGPWRLDGLAVGAWRTLDDSAAFAELAAHRRLQSRHGHS